MKQSLKISRRLPGEKNRMEGITKYDVAPTDNKSIIANIHVLVARPLSGKLLESNYQDGKEMLMPAKKGPRITCGG